MASSTKAERAAKATAKALRYQAEAKAQSDPVVHALLMAFKHLERAGEAESPPALDEPLRAAAVAVLECLKLAGAPLR